MLDANMIIANNIRAELEKENKNQSDLAKEIGVSKKTMSKIMSGARAISAIELRRISECLNVTVGSLLKMPESLNETNGTTALMARAKTEEARMETRLAEKLPDLILFRTNACENGKKIKQSMDE